MSDRYWLSTPGSKEPPKGPLSLQEITEAWQAGTIEPVSIICKVGESNWVNPESVLGPRVPRARTGELPQVFPLPDRRSIEGKYSDLARVASSLEFYGTALKVLVVIIGIASLAAVIYLIQSLPSALIALFVGVVSGVWFYAMGILIAGAGNALLAVRDMAVNTRVSADMAMRPSP